MALQNMKAELTRYGITQRQVAEGLGMSLGNFNLKINEEIPMTIDELKAIRRDFLPDVEYGYLIVSDKDKAEA